MLCRNCASLFGATGVFSILKNSASIIGVRKLGTKNAKIGFIGLGNMGSGMATNLLKKDYEVLVKDLDAGRERKLQDKGAKVAKDYKEIAASVDYVITMLPASQQVLQIYCGENGLIENLKPGTTAIDCSTVDYTTPRLLGEKFEERGVTFIDAPVSGGMNGAASGTLTFMVGGKKETFANVEPILRTMGKKLFYCGPLGSGQIVKMCNNLLLAIAAVGVAETFVLGSKLGIDPKVLTSVVNSSSGRCWLTEACHPVPGVMENVPSCDGYKAGFTSQMILKDLEIIARSASGVSSPMNLGQTVLKVYKDMCKTDLKDYDFTVVYDYMIKSNK